ncbi:CUB domain-containing protein 1a [Neolamprologus brichardi]|uniref:CUB domain-containing protein 1a n=1 Tax=Neolamprologus brichardi TaxID=32507 RepID=UPI001643A58E|nr:CUB domain-containing protein 1a [Neolamprologus brichardi]
MSVSAGAALLWILLLTFTVSTVSGAQKLTLTAEPGATINIRNNNKVKGCKVCTGSIIKKCNAGSLNYLKGTTVELKCSRPQDVFSIEIVRRITCTTESCSGHIIQTDFSSTDALRFNRTFTWNLEATAPKAFQIDFTNTGLKQINPSEKCPDRHTYTLQAFQSTGNVAVGKYCRSGTISSAQVLKSGSFSVDVPAEQKLQNDKFDVTVREKIKSLARISLTLPKGTSSSELLSPDYPESFPDDDTMEWYFHIPDKHGVDVQFLKLTQPDCVKKEVAVEYHQKGRVTSVLGLNETQPLQNQGDFLLTLRNCEMERAPADSPGLTFTLKVSASSPASTALLNIILGVVATLLVISVIVLVVMIRKNKKKKKKKKKKGNHEVAVYNPNGINFLPGYKSPDVLGTCKDDESHVYEEIDDTLVYTHLLKRAAETGNYEETCKPVSGHRDSQKPLLSSQQGPPRPNKPPSKIRTPVDNTIYQNMIYQPKDQSEDEKLPNLGASTGARGKQLSRRLDSYCRSGTISSAQVLKSGSFSVDVPAEQKLQNDKFDVTVREKIKWTSSSELLSPNYPESFPDDDIMEWYFQVPDKHGVDVQFLKLTQPDCVKKEVAVEYHQKGRVTSVLGLNETQPLQNQGDFLLTLRNCEMERAPADSPGLTFTLKVSASSPASTVLYQFHLRTSFRSDCSSGKCPDPVSLSVPLLPSCLPAPLSRVTWTLRPGQHGTVKLISPNGPLKQSLPGQLCDDSITIDVAEENGTTIGTFCPNGAIQTVHIHTSVSVTWWSSMNAKAPRSAVLNASFEKEITERYIFTVSPKRDTPELVATPAWPAGMKAHSTVSWIVSVPPKMEAQLIFTKLSQPKCINRHTNIRVQRMGSTKEDYSRREDEVANSELTVSESFYLNMSNCLPERGNFSVITKISLQKSKGSISCFFCSPDGCVSVWSLHAWQGEDSAYFNSRVAVAQELQEKQPKQGHPEPPSSQLPPPAYLEEYCCISRKKKKKLNHEVSVYNPNGINFLPGYNGPPKTHEDDDAHVYTSIDDTLVYTHLLKKGADIGIYGETYQHFTGHTDSQKPLLSSQKGPPLPNRSPGQEQTLMDQSEDEQSSNLGPRLEPEGGN